jgi:hypothetical protein
MLTTEDKKKITIKFQKEHEKLFKKLNVTNPYFKCKVPYMSSINQEKVIGIFKSEFDYGIDIYVQLVYTDYNPYEQKKDLYVIKKNPHYNKEYKSIGEGTNIRYEIPVDELILADEIIDLAYEDELDVEELYDDIPLSTATLRDFAAVMLKKPVSNKKWLNDIINKK